MELLKSSYGHFMDPEQVDDGNNATVDVRNASSNAFHCPYCFDTLETEELLRMHKRAHHEHKRYTCKFCKAIFTSMVGWQYHYRKHTNDLRYSCDSCKLKFCTFQQLVIHCGNHKHFCDQCGKGFVWPKLLRKHEIDDHGIYGDEYKPDGVDESKQFRCEKCNITFPTCGLWRRHLKNNQLCRPFVCVKCKSGFMTEIHFKSHMSFFTNCRDVMEKRKRKNLKNQMPQVQVLVSRIDQTKTTPIKQQTTNVFICNNCDRWFPKIQLRREHWIRKVECRPYGCNNCNAKFVTKDDIEKHVRIHMFKCHLCARTYSFKSDFDAHYCRSRNRAIDAKLSAATSTPIVAKKDFVCQYCEKTYYTEEELQDHIDFVGEFIYTCSKCYEVFQNECTFGHHLLNSHEVPKNCIFKE